MSIDYDAKAIETLVSHDGALAVNLCHDCGKAMYRPKPFPGVPSEWRHRSSGHAISYSPEKHLAGLVLTTVHQHRFGADRNGMRFCEVPGCTSEMPIVSALLRPEAVVLSEKEAALLAARQRGSLHQKKPPKVWGQRGKVNPI